MNKNLNIRLQYLVAAVLLLFISAGSFSQLRLYQKKETAKYIQTSRDTLISPYIQGTIMRGIITNDSETGYLEVWLSKKDSTMLDSTSYARVGPGSKLRFEFQGKRIFRNAVSDSVFSQVLYGDNVDIGPGGKRASGATFNAYGYAHKDSANSFTEPQTFDSVSITDEMVADTVRTNTILPRVTGTMNILNTSTENTVIGRLDQTSYMSVYGTSSANAIFFAVQNTEQMYIQTTGTLFGGISVTGKPYIHSTPTLSTVHFSFANDPNTGIYRPGADSLQLVTNGVARATVSTTSFDFNLPMRPPPMTETARDLLTPAFGWIIANTTTSKLNFYNGSAWEVITSAP